MSVNRISLDVTDAKKAEVASKTSALAASTKELEVIVTKEELDGSPKIADGRIPFVQKSADYSVSNPEHRPMVLDNDEFQKDVKTFLAMREMARPLRQILEGIETAMAVAGSVLRRPRLLQTGSAQRQNGRPRRASHLRRPAPALRKHGQKRTEIVIKYSFSSKK